MSNPTNLTQLEQFLDRLRMVRSLYEDFVADHPVLVKDARLDELVWEVDNDLGILAGAVLEAMEEEPVGELEVPAWVSGFKVDRVARIVRHSDHTLLDGAFAWEDTPEGVVFWHTQAAGGRPLDVGRLKEMLKEYKEYTS